MKRHRHHASIRSTYQSLLTKGFSIFVVISLFIPQALVFAQENMTEIPSTDSLSVDFSVSPIDESTQIQTNSEQIIDSPVETILKEDPIEETAPQPKPEEEPTLETSEDPSLTGENPFPQKEQSKTQIKPEIDQTTGALSYVYPFTLPEGRAGLTPSLSLTYNSQETSNDSITGYGWNLSIPSIKRVNKYGVDKLYDPLTETFVSSLDGELIKITNTNTYRPKVDNGTYHLYTYINNTWSVTTKEGTTYAFGTTAQSRQDDPQDPSRVYAWNVETITDSTNNTINYTYLKDQGQVYPQTISYASIFSIEFELENYVATTTTYDKAFPLKTNHRISSIDVKVNDQLTKKHTFTYTVGDAGYRSLLESITESGYTPPSLIPVTLPPTTFMYKDRGTLGWTNGPGWELPVVISYNEKSRRVQLIDINGDAYIDILYLTNAQSNIPCEHRKIYLNNTDGTFTLQDCLTEWATPFSLKDYNYTSRDGGFRMFDYNGDNLTDAVKSVNQYYEPGVVTSAEGYRNNLNPNNPWQAQAVNTPVGFVFNPTAQYDNATQIIDMNADGVSDIVRGTLDDDNGPSLILVENSYIGNGTATWVETGSGEWELPWGIIDENFAGDLMPTNAQFTDFNGDGLVDYVFRKSNQSILGVNNGKTWVDPNVCVNFPIPTQASSYAAQAQSDTGVRMFDVNGDGVSDVVQAYRFGGNNYISTDVILNSLDESNCIFKVASQFNPALTSPLAFAVHGNSSQTVGIVDINADGMIDLIRANEDPNPDPNVFTYETYLGGGSPYTDKLIGITTPTSLHTDITYKPSTHYKDGSGALLNPHLPLIIDTVNTITTTDLTTGVSSKSEYTYSGGEYFYAGPHDKKFAGFEKVEEKIYDNNTNTLMKEVVTYFHQGDLDNLMPNTNAPLTALGEEPDTRSKIGKVWRTEMYDGGGNIQEKTMTRWGQSQIVPGSFRVYPTSTLTQSYDGATHTDIGHIYTYSAQGNLLTDTDFGLVTGQNNGSFGDTGTDKRTTTTTWVISQNSKVHKPSKINIKNFSNVIEKETKYQYDNLSSGVTTGLLTREDVWKSGTGVTATYTTTKYAYNPQGLMTSKIDPNGNTTTYAYGSTNLYPSSVTEPQNMVTTYLYNNTLGKITQMTDPNNRTWKWTYDALGRLLTEQIPYDSNPTTQITKTTYVYNDTPTLNNPVYIRKTSSGPTTNEYTLLDGFGRPIRILTQTGGTSYAATDTTYDSLGRTLTTSLPFSYVSNPTAYTGVLAPSNLQTSYSYDGQDRVLSATDVHGTTTYTYAGLIKTVTDVLGNQKKYTTDVFGNLVEVREKIGATWYPTSYTYNTQNNLMKITDALGNIRNFTYDGLGRRLTAEDLHAPGDLNFGTYTYTYDDNGNLLTMVTPEGDTIVYTYDARNRVLTEKLATDSSPRITYTYDQGTDGKGRLTSVTQSNGTNTTFAYTGSGKKKTETITISGSTPQLFSYGYDVQGSNTRVTYPDLSQTITTVSYRNLPTQVQYQVGGTNTNLASSVTYNPMGQVVSYARTNGIVTTNTYDANQGYRLTKRVSQKSGQPKIQDISYTYDAVGNITTLLDNSVSATKKTASYTYDDLYRLTSATVTNTAVGQAPYTETFTYNPIGNLLSKNGTTYSYTTPNKVNPHAPTGIGGQTLSYSDNGNLLTDGLHTNTYNYKNELSTTTSNSITSNFTYNHEGQRVKKVTNTSEIYSPTPFYTLDNTKKTKTVSLGDLNIGTIETDTILGSTTHTPRYAITDHLGSIEKTTDQNAQIISTLDYYPYGSTRIDTGGTPERTYIGERFDPESGYSYLNARYYNANSGVFVSQDPVFWEVGQSKDGKKVLLSPQAQNSYSYALGDPINKKDANGRCATSGGVSMSACLGMVAGIGQGVADTAIGMYTLATTNPLTSAQNMYNGIKNLPQSAKEYTQLQNDPNVSDFDKAKAGGEVAFGLFAMKGAGKSVVSNLSTNSAIAKSTRYATSEAKLSHIFNNPRHNLDSLVKSYGTRESVMKGVITELYRKNLAKGTFNNIIVRVGGTSITVRGVNQNGIIKIGTMFKK